MIYALAFLALWLGFVLFAAVGIAVAVYRERAERAAPVRA